MLNKGCKFQKQCWHKCWKTKFNETGRHDIEQIKWKWKYMYIIKPHSVINQSYYLNFANTINTGMSEIRVLKSLNYYVFCDTIFFLFTAKDKLFNSIWWNGQRQSWVSPKPWIMMWSASMSWIWQMCSGILMETSKR